jgi:hypothetical protein
VAHLGEFGRARALEKAPDEPDTFTFHGQQFEIPGGISIVVLMDFIADQQEASTAREEALASKDDVELVAASNRLLACMRDYCRSCLGTEAAWRRFDRVCRKHAVDIDELMEVCAAIFSAVAARPTTRPSESSDGPSSTGAGSTDGSDSQAATPGPSPHDDGDLIQGEILGEVIELTPAQRQLRDVREQMVPVGVALRSGT